MSLTPAICTQCGAKIEVDNSKDAAICEYCGTPFIVEKAINNYNTNYTTTVIADSVMIVGQESADMIANTIQKFIDAEEYTTANEYLKRMEESFSTDYRVYIYKILIETKNFSEANIRYIYNNLSHYQDLYNKTKVLNDAIDEDFCKSFEKYMQAAKRIKKYDLETEKRNCEIQEQEKEREFQEGMQKHNTIMTYIWIILFCVIIIIRVIAFLG